MRPGITLSHEFAICANFFAYIYIPNAYNNLSLALVRIALLFILCKDSEMTLESNFITKTIKFHLRHLIHTLSRGG